MKKDLLDKNSKTHKLLIIDDEKEFCALLREFYSEEGYAVECAHDGKEGLGKVESFAPDIILLDHRMSNMDGFTMLRNIKEFCSTPVIVVSAITDKEIIAQYIILGIRDYISKPVNLEDLNAAVKLALRVE